MDNEEIIRRLKKISEHAVHVTGEPPFIMSLDDGIALDEAARLLKGQEAKTGHWIDTTKVIGFPRVRCSVCGSGQGAIWMDYCPNCGAKMET